MSNEGNTGAWQPPLRGNDVCEFTKRKNAAYDGKYLLKTPKLVIFHRKSRVLGAEIGNIGCTAFRKKGIRRYWTLTI